jgi:hypothetical protein
MSKSPRTPRFKEEMSDELAELLKNQRQIKDWQSAIHKRVSRLEELYLKETSMGNIIRGFDLDATQNKDKNRHKDNKDGDDKERMFSGSSFEIYSERQLLAQNKANGNAGIGAGVAIPPATNVTAAQAQAQAQEKVQLLPAAKKARKGE